VLLAIDPGSDTGWALFRSDGILYGCGLGDPRLSEKHRMGDITEVVIECPYVYPGGKTKDPNAIVTLALNAGTWAGRYERCNVRYVRPWQWKGQTPKEIHHERIRAKLDASETAIVTGGTARFGARLPKSKAHNVLDAVGLGLFAVGR
jgi:hypothetical protein